jgi:ACT domain-containing protein
MKAVITVIGRDMVGILAKVADKCAGYNANIIDVTQTVMEDIFAMVMLVDISRLNADFARMAEELRSLGASMGLSVHAMHEDIFNSMHKI